VDVKGSVLPERIFVEAIPLEKKNMNKERGMTEICRKAHAIVQEHPELSFDDVRRILMRLDLTPRQRLDKSLVRRSRMPVPSPPGESC
jgi:hypothetical protein